MWDRGLDFGDGRTLQEGSHTLQQQTDWTAVGGIHYSEVQYTYLVEHLTDPLSIQVSSNQRILSAVCGTYHTCRFPALSAMLVSTISPTPPSGSQPLYVVFALTQLQLYL